MRYIYTYNQVYNSCYPLNLLAVYIKGILDIVLCFIKVILIFRSTVLVTENIVGGLAELVIADWLPVSSGWLWVRRKFFEIQGRVDILARCCNFQRVVYRPKAKYELEYSWRCLPTSLTHDQSHLCNFWLLYIAGQNPHILSTYF